MSERPQVASALKNALSKDVNADDDGNFTAELDHSHLQASLGSGVVQQALVNSGYTIVPAENGFAITYDTKDVGKLYGKDKAPKKDDEKKN